MSDSTDAKEYNLEKDCELRFEIESKIQVTVEVSVTAKNSHIVYQFSNKNMNCIYDILAKIRICRAIWYRAG